MIGIAPLPAGFCSFKVVFAKGPGTWDSYLISGMEVPIPRARLSSPCYIPYFRRKG